MADGSIEHIDAFDDEALPVGTSLCGDQFTITEHLGAGGFGITYRAKDNVLGRIVVIKECFPAEFCVRHGIMAVPRSRAHAQPMHSIVKMFMHEARSLAKLRHPNIVGVHRAFEENETAYMALDLIEGRDLLEILETCEKRLPPTRVTDILLQLLNAIEKVHDIGILHRDISPDNILLEPDGTPVLIDFGAARADPNRHTRVASSLLVVKDGYSPQEFYLVGSEQGPCSDLYALAATFYHVLSGEPPPDSQTRMMEIAGRQPDPCVPLAGRIDGYDEEFLKAIDQAMAVHPKDRLQSAAKWRSMITTATSTVVTKPLSDALPPAPQIPLELEISLSRLVEETNDEVRRISQAIVAPAPAKAPERPTSKWEWIDEFNEEALTRKEQKQKDRMKRPQKASDGPAEDSAAADQSQPAKPRSRSETDWVERAHQKQERIRSRQESAYGIAETTAEIAPETQPRENPSRPLKDWDQIPSAEENSLKSRLKVAGVFACLLLSVGVVASFEMKDTPATSNATPSKAVVIPKVNSLEMNGSIIR